MEIIKDIDSYNSSMRLSIQDKLFFIPLLPGSGRKYTFVDFGCADGSLLTSMCNLLRDPYNSQNRYIGYDCSPEMINLAKSRFFGEIRDDIVFLSSWDNVKKELEGNNNKVLILSSVIHEVYSYAPRPQDVEEFWDKVLKTGFDYIVVRDMMVDEDYYYHEAPDEIVKAISENQGRVFDAKQWKDFISHWVHSGSKLTIHDVLHFLLKYKWKVNWDRELTEDYFPITSGELLNKFLDPCLSNAYNLEYMKRFRVEFLDNLWKNELGLEMDKYGYNTHIKAIFRKKL